MRKSEKTPTDKQGQADCEKPEHEILRPFDTSELDKLPQPTKEDPPYRPWWVVDRT